MMQYLLTQDGNAIRNYTEAVHLGAYDRPPDGLNGKYDNVRRFWEDAVTSHALGQFLAPLLDQKRAELSRLKVLDLGCGSGAGYEFVSAAVGPSLVGYYKGVDINEAMVEKARELYADDTKCSFVLGDLNDGLPIECDEPICDLIFSSYASLSHLCDESLEQLLQQIFHHMGEHIVFVADLLGRYSYEWPCYWDTAGESEAMHTYSMSYIYPPDLREHAAIERFPSRFWGGEEFDRFVQKIADRCRVTVTRRELRDRSIMVGRHMDTQEFNSFAPPLRSMVNSLFEPLRRTDINQLLFDYHHCGVNTAINDFFDRYQMAWNVVVATVMDELMMLFDETSAILPAFAYMEPVQHIIKQLRGSIRIANEWHWEDIIADWIEPQLARALCRLEQEMQQGLGVGHGLLAYYEFRKG